MKKTTSDIRYGIHTTPFGTCLIALMGKDICLLSFHERLSDRSAEKEIKAQWPHVSIQKDTKGTLPYIKKVFGKAKEDFNLMLTGTDFQMKVWERLLRIPYGKTMTYQEVAHAIGRPKAVRAVGTACGKNAIAYLVPCHRVLASNGSLGGYRWGLARKKKLIEAERG